MTCKSLYVTSGTKFETNMTTANAIVPVKTVIWSASVNDRIQVFL